jgi:hypothetical protein
MRIYSTGNGCRCGDGSAHQSPDRPLRKAGGQARARALPPQGGASSGAAGRRGAAARALYLARRREPSLDARRDLSGRRRGGQCDGRSRAGRGRGVTRGRLCGRRPRFRRYRLAGLRGIAGADAAQAAEDHAAHASAQRLRYCGPHRLFRPAACRASQGGRDRRGLGRGRLGRLARRPDRQDQGLPRGGNRRRPGEMRLAHGRARFRRGGRLQGRQPVQGAQGRGPARHRRLFRQCRRRGSGSVPRADEPARPHCLLWRSLAIRRRAVRTRAARHSGIDRGQAPRDAGLHRHRLLQGTRAGTRGPPVMGRRRHAQGAGGRDRRAGEHAACADRPPGGRQSRQAA